MSEVNLLLLTSNLYSGASITYVPVLLWPYSALFDKSSRKKKEGQISSIDLLAPPQVKNRCSQYLKYRSRSPVARSVHIPHLHLRRRGCLMRTASGAPTVAFQVRPPGSSHIMNIHRVMKMKSLQTNHRPSPSFVISRARALPSHGPLPRCFLVSAAAGCVTRRWQRATCGLNARIRRAAAGGEES